MILQRSVSFFASCVITLFVVMSLIGCHHKQSERSKSRAPLLVGMDLSFPPFEMIDVRGDPAGISVELARGIAKFIGQPLKIENIPFVGLIPALNTGKIDLIISSLSATEERKKVILFSDQYWSLSMGVLAKKDSSLQSTDLSELDQPGHFFAVRQGNLGETWAKEHLHHAEMCHFDQEASAVLEVSQGKVDGFIYDQLSVFRNAQRYPKTTKALLQPFATNSWVMGMRLGNTRLQHQVNAFLKKFRAEGGRDHLTEIYLKDAKQAFEKQHIPF